MIAEWSNCWIEAHHLGRRLKGLGAEVVHIPTTRDYRWCYKASHAFVRLRDGTEIEFVPVRCIGNDDPRALGIWPWPIFRGAWRVRKPGR